MNKNDGKRDRQSTARSREALEKSLMMAHLLEALDHKTDIGEYGRLTFVMVARFFLGEDEMVNLLKNQPGPWYYR